jgi:hypothetical protein
MLFGFVESLNVESEAEAETKTKCRTARTALVGGTLAGGGVGRGRLRVIGGWSYYPAVHVQRLPRVRKFDGHRERR